MSELRNRILEKLRFYEPRQIQASDRIPAAVLMPFFEKDGEPHLLFTKRTAHVQYHRGEICFPGGAQERIDASLQATALRELYEEIQVPSHHVEILGRLDSIRTVSSYFLVVPYVGYLKEVTRFEPDPLEVEEILQIPFRHFEDPSIFSEEIRIVEQEPHAVYYYQWQSHTIWGLTARILKTLLDLLRT